MNTFMPHGYCMRWDFWLLVQHVLSDLFIAIAYFTIPAALVTVVRRRKDVGFGFLFWLFSLFIFSCGITHLLEIYVLWKPVYWVAGWAKVFTAAASVTTAIVLWRVIPQAIHLPTPQQLAEAREQTETEVSLRREAEREIQLKDDFLATLSHELRTPLTAILGWTQMLETGGLSETQSREAIKVIDRNARIQAQLINDLLDLSAISSGKMRVEMRDVNISEVITSVVETVRPLANARKILITFLDDGNKTFFVSGDEKRLEQVFWNLLSNSLKFTEEGGRIDVSVQAEGSHVKILVIDNGVGISKDYLPLIFNKFSQADNTLARSKGGLGIGLALVSELIQRHGGTISAESEGLGKGSTFTVDLPLSPPPRAAEKIPMTQRPSLAGRYILVVEDEEDSRRLFEEIFRKAGAEVLGVGSATEAYNEVRRRRPSAIVSDLAMPGHDGLWLIRKVRELSECHAELLPALSLSAMTRDADRQGAINAGFQKHLGKPVSPEILLQAVYQLLEETPQG